MSPSAQEGPLARCANEAVEGVCPRAAATRVAREAGTRSRTGAPIMRGIAILVSLVLGLAASGAAHARSPCGGTRFDVQTVAADSRPFVRLTLGGRTGPFLLDFGATASTVARSVWNAPGPDIRLSGFNLPSFSVGTFGLRDDALSLGKLGTVHGV